MTESNKIAWKQISIEAVAIVLSILLAFAIDAWWTDLQRSADESESIELIKRDIESSIEMLEYHVAFSRTAAQSAADAYTALSGPGPYDREKIHGQILQVDRLTMRVPRAAYSDLLSTGNLRIIEDRALRDAVIRFYETQERAELIILKNNDVFLDRQLLGTLFADGLVYPRSQVNLGDRNVDRAYEGLNRVLGEQFEHMEDPMWKFAPDSREWDRLRGAVLSAALIHVIGEDIAEARIVEAEKLLESIEAWQNK